MFGVDVAPWIDLSPAGAKLYASSGACVAGPVALRRASGRMRRVLQRVKFGHGCKFGGCEVLLLLWYHRLRVIVSTWERERPIEACAVDGPREYWFGERRMPSCFVYDTLLAVCLPAVQQGSHRLHAYSAKWLSFEPGRVQQPGRAVG